MLNLLRSIKWGVSLGPRRLIRLQAGLWWSVDAPWYGENHGVAVWLARFHFLFNGVWRGLDPSPWLSIDEMRSGMPNGAISYKLPVLSAFLHWGSDKWIGTRWERRYLALNPDVRAYEWPPSVHYCRFRHRELRITPSPDSHRFCIRKMQPSLSAETPIDSLMAFSPNFVANATWSASADKQLEVRSGVLLRAESQEHSQVLPTIDCDHGAYWYRAKLNDTALRVLIFSHENSFTGAPIIAEQIAIMLRSYGARVSAVVLRCKGTDLFSRAGISTRCVYDSNGGVPLLHGWLLTAEGQECVRDIAAREQPHVVIVNSIVAGDVSKILTQLGIPFVLYVHESKGFTSPCPTSGLNWFDEICQAALSTSVLNIFGSDASKAAWGGLAVGPRNFTLPSVIRPPVPNATRSHIDSSLTGDGAKTLLLSVASYEPRKRLRDIALAYERASLTHARLRFVGKSGVSSAFEDQLSSELCRKGIEQVVATPDLAKHFDEASALILASQDETFPLVLQEAAWRRIPRIVARYPGYEQAVSSESALLYDVGDIDALARAMRAIVDDRGLRERLAERAYEAQRGLYESFVGNFFHILDMAHVEYAQVVPRNWFHGSENA